MLPVLCTAQIRFHSFQFLLEEVAEGLAALRAAAADLLAGMPT
jgi:hypothetical protein